jgi:hypothetical protein
LFLLTTEAVAYLWVSAENGHSSTYKLLTLDTRKIIYHSRIRIASEDPTL